jgi:hypothetical protein
MMNYMQLVLAKLIATHGLFFTVALLQLRFPLLVHNNIANSNLFSSSLSNCVLSLQISSEQIEEKEQFRQKEEKKKQETDQPN